MTSATSTTTATPIAAPAGPLGPLPVPVLDAGSATAAVSGAAVVLLPRWTLGLAEELSRHALDHPVEFVPVRFDGALAVVGPVLRPGAAACLCCAEYQRLATAGGRVPWRSPTLELAGVPSPALSESLGALALELLEPAAPEGTGPGAESGTEPGAGSAVVYVVHLGRGTWSTHRVRPVGGCAVCHPLPADSASDVAPLPSAPRPLPDPYVLRAPNPLTAPVRLREALYDERFGPVRALFRSEDSAFCLTSAFVTDGRLVDDGGYGRARDFGDSERIALFESVERYTGMRPTGRRTGLRASFAELGPERAVDPERLGLPDPAHHGHPSSPTVPYTPNLVMDWVHGWSLTRRRPTAVPEHVAYWDVPGAADRPRVVYESSNGCGLGNSPEEAALYGLFEVAERDAFLMAWYAATPLRRVLPPPDDLDTALLADRAALAGYRLVLLDATNDFDVPAVVAVCRYEGSHPDAPRMFLAAGAHHDPRAAIRSAVAEVVTNVLDAGHRALAEGGPRDPRRLRPMLDRPDLVVSLDDHVGVNTLPEAGPRLEFLFADTPRLSVEEAWPGAPEPVGDLADLLGASVERLSRAGLEVVTVDQSERGLRRRLGLHAVKVVVPGALPMTFGHVNHRTRGFPRLLEVPYRLGRTERPLRPEDLAVHPHPFP
ncbi:TOMM precursor leader peptide-binding protein [Streptomyces sp. H27-G5]|uniref:TOMM precursor leader peptide-binding protein n=1 Tax=Streptomyces sp. H27-G5 TaxID=2996698 RepID=UPI00226E9CD1|nr:TOMM precursor leader peptide-binding protein [Streptomyces sp. H27-G5]MCY0917355.1 TOMM precursor leader peptide-binding protein [Streptomyces sp. H27-G5]